MLSAGVNVNDKFSLYIKSQPNTIQEICQQDISAGTIHLPIIQKIKHYGQNESYLTQCHTKGFQNIRLVSLYSKSVSCENSKCLHFASVQMKHSSKQAIFSLIPNRVKNESYLTQWHTKGFHNIKLVSLYSNSVSGENSKCLHFASVQMKHIVQNRPLKAYGTLPLYQIWLIFSFCVE